ncbi:hypothetical protein F5984_20465 [Rudanella paleaurantiibacter]|uniref:SGNH hydrolase-type esterase domain-containing protein n=1 Tax=Rudanella paleaurantiibacter TaxID=2614655 RepID=A0A7J5TVE6_9BACT|nr:SGNH/GDSL hydrolase family protein [Rudanella paleaurantiibacter]KAB7728122.1 hypothetical protein F5984_20465 [Rudanella paleaurantiibacter]
MKKLMIMLLCLLSTAISFGQSYYLNERDRAVAEGMPMFDVYLTLSGSLTAVQSKGIAPQPGTSWYLDSYTMSSNVAAGLVTQFVNSSITPPLSATPTVPPYDQAEFGQYGGSVSKDVGRLLIGQTGINFSNKRPITDATFQGTLTVSGTRVSADFNKPAERIILKLGDSISEGAALTLAEQEYDFQLRDSLQKYTLRSWRIINKAKGSYTSSNLEGLRAQQNLFFPRVDVVLYAVGTNDASATTYDANLAAMLRFLTFQYPRAVIVICTPTVRQAPQETINAAIRTAAAARVAALNNPRIVVANWGALWTQAQMSTYMNADNVHPAPAGHLLMGAQAWNLFLANNSRLLKLVTSGR